MFRKGILTIVVVLLASTMVWAGGWDKNKGLDKITITGELVCIGCSLKKMSGANAQCNLYAHHAIGFKAQDGTLWSIVDNEKGHDIIRAHKLLEKKKATITGWLYPLAHYIEIDTITVEGVSMDEIQEEALREDKLLAKRLLTREKGKVPTMAHEH